MANELVVLEKQFQPMLPQYEQALAGRLPAARLVRSVLVSCEKTPRLLQATRQSLFNAAMSAAMLALEVDGVTGQAFIIPYNIKGTLTAQMQIGYKGMNTLAARSGYTVTAGIIRDGDDYEYQVGTGGFVRVRPKLGNKARMIGAWANAESRHLPSVPIVLSIDEIMAVKDKSPGGKKQDSPWNDPAIGFLAMAEKTARRRLARSMPLNADTRDYHIASRMEEAFEEQGQPSWIRNDGTVMVEGKASPIATSQADDQTPRLEDLEGPKTPVEIADLMEEGKGAADGGTAVVAAWWGRLTPRQQTELREWKDTTLKPLAEAVDRGEPI